MLRFSETKNMDVRLQRWWKRAHVRGTVDIHKSTETHTCTILEKTSNENDFSLSLHLELAAGSSLWKNIEVNCSMRMKVADHVWCKCKVDHVDKLDGTKPNRTLRVTVRWRKVDTREKVPVKVVCYESNPSPALQNEKEVKGSKKRDTKHEDEESSKKLKVDPIDSEIPDLKTEDGHEAGVNMEAVQVKTEEHTGKSKGKKKGYAPNERMTEFLTRYKKDIQANPKKKSKRLTLKDVKEAHGANEISKEDAILSIMMVHYMAGTKALTFERIFTELGYRPKNKAVEKAWKSVREDNLVEADETTKKAYRLTDTGLDRAAPPGYKEELAKALPQTTAELHERIKETAVNPYGILIFEILHEARDKGEGMTPRELADTCGVNKDSHGFFYGFKWLKDNEYAIPDSGTKRPRKYSLNDEKCFVGDYSPKKISSKE